MVSYHLQSGDEIVVSNVIRTTLSISNSRDYTPCVCSGEYRRSFTTGNCGKNGGSPFYIVEDGKQIIGCGGIIDTGAAQQKAIWFLFSFCLHIRERALEETLLKRWRRMRIFCGPGGQKWVLR